jgi:glycerol-3-phosphate dehydrogenase
MRPEILLRTLAETAARSGADLCTGTVVARLLQEGDEVFGVETASGEKIPARLVILAGNARCGSLYPEFGTEAVGSQRDVALVALKTHLVAVRPNISPWPLCVVDAEGFNHVPHQAASVFGTSRWLPLHNAEDEQSLASEIDRLWSLVRRFFPDFSREDHTTLEWAGNTLQAMHLDQVEPGQIPWPTVVDHERERPQLKNLVSVFPGRASLWAYLAEQAQRVVLQKLETSETIIAAPPWGSLDAGLRV